MGLPPDLDRLGDALVGAVRASRARRDRRRRVALAGVVGALAFAGLNPGALAPAQRELALTAAERLEPPGCRLPRGAQFTMAACKGAMVLDRPRAWN